MGLYQRENLVWYAKLTKNNRSIRKSLQTTSKKEAELRYALMKEEFLRQIMSGRDRINISSPSSNGDFLSTTLEFDRPTFNQAMEEYKDHLVLKFTSEANLKEKESLFGVLKSHKFEWSYINQKDIVNFQKDLLGIYSKSYSAKLVTHFKAFLKFCITKEYLTHNQFVRLDFIKAPKIKRKKKTITKEHILKILKYCEQKGDLDFYNLVFQHSWFG
ncbi:MAG: hypothetical protein ACRCV0_03265 [Brevinema sp.]